MKIALILLILAAGTSNTEDLVEAAKEAKAKRKKPSTKVLTNKDVRNSKGTLIVLPASETDAAEEKKPDGPSPLEVHDASYRARLELEENTAEARKKVSALEKELEHLEYRYYEENNPDRRDLVIRKQFEDVQEKLNEAKSELRELQPEPRAPSPEP